MADITQLIVPVRDGATITMTTLDIADSAVRDLIPSSASSSNKLATQADIPSGSSGHIIENPSGAAMAARANLQFQGLSVTDDSENDRTVVSLSISGTASAGAFLTSDGNGGYQWSVIPQAEGSSF